MCFSYKNYGGILLQQLKEKILSESKVLSKEIIKVDAFINHQIDPILMKEIGQEFCRRFSDTEITKVLTIESSGIAPALMTALELDVPLVFARKKKSLTLRNHLYESKVFSFTKKEVNHITVSKDYITEEDRVLVIDDFLANGQAADGLIDIVEQSGAHLVGIGILIEKVFQEGGKLLRDRGIRIESLAMIASLEEGKVIFAE